MTENEKLDLLLTAMTNLQDNVKSEFEKVNNRIDSVELQIKSSERQLRYEIKKSENLILSEVERVHGILDDHKHDKAKHALSN